ncbi:MAG: beta-ribofuranosylaminobenzene 5'-phosphate synthase [Candidatus Poribacteria bacterium]|nr:beta-ribofuranosylaminobenzene 5'-phosphate synthase [Candidatus Poribacteria bacterium]
MRHIRVITPARLHFGLIDLNGALGRIDGGIGIAINDPTFELIAKPSQRIEIKSWQYEERVHAILERLQSKHHFPGLHVEFVSEIPAHSGFGSGTQLALALGQAVNTLYDLNLSVPELAFAVARGGTSGIGVAAFDQGGFVLDGGHSYPDRKSSFLPSSAVGNVPPPPILLRYPFPSWELLIVSPNCKHISGKAEVNPFQTLCPQPQSTAERLSHIILMKLLPSIYEGNLEAFGDAINRIQTFGWKKVEIDAQRGVLQQTLDFLRDSGALGAGVSSWGPAIFAVGENLPALHRKTEAFLDSLPNGGSCFVTQANNVGARVKLT